MTLLFRTRLSKRRADAIRHLSLVAIPAPACSAYVDYTNVPNAQLSPQPRSQGNLFRHRKPARPSFQATIPYAQVLRDPVV